MVPRLVGAAWMGEAYMTYSLTWLSLVLRAAGLVVKEQPGWQTRGHGDMKGVKGILCHHTASNRNSGNAPSLKICTEGRPDLAGPLSQLVLGRDGTYYIVAAGKCYHAGKGSWPPLGLADNGNSWLIGIEAENDGIGEPWPEVQMEAYEKGVAAMLRHLSLPIERVIGHKEYAPKRKTDPSFDMEAFRNNVNSLL